MDGVLLTCYTASHAWRQRCWMVGCWTITSASVSSRPCQSLQMVGSVSAAVPLPFQCGAGSGQVRSDSGNVPAVSSSDSQITCTNLRGHYTTRLYRCPLPASLPIHCQLTHTLTHTMTQTHSTTYCVQRTTANTCNRLIADDVKVPTSLLWTG